MGFLGAITESGETEPIDLFQVHLVGFLVAK